MARSPTVLRDAEFDPRVRIYWMLNTIILCVVTVVGIPLLLILVPVVFWFMDRWLAAMRCALTDRTLELKKGVFNRVQSTIPLEKITDLQLYQGPIMRALGLQGFRVETAGQTSAPGASLVNVIGIVDTEGFREAVLEQRDRLAGLGMRDDGTGDVRAAPGAGPGSIVGTGEALAELRSMHDTLRRIEQRLDARSE